MKHVPKYLLPKSAAPVPGTTGRPSVTQGPEGEGEKPAGFVPFRKTAHARGRGRGRERGRGGHGKNGGGGRGGKKKSDPLKKFGR